MENINIKNLFNSPNASSTQIVSENELQKLVDVLTSKITELENNPVDSRPYKVYSALLSQFSTDAPTVIVLENTIGNVVWSRASAGLYNATLSGAFPDNSTFIPNHQANDVDFNVSSIRYDDDTVSVITLNPTSGFGIDGVLELYPIEIRVYN